MAIYQPGVPDSRDARCRRPLAGAARRGSERRRRSRPPDPDAARDPRRDQQRSAPRDHRAGHHERQLPPAPPARTSSTTTRDSAIPIAGKTGTAQGAGNYPWNDSSAFAALQPGPGAPVHGHRLPREGRLRLARPPGRSSSACSCRCPASPTPTRSCCPTSSTRRRTSPRNRGSWPTRVASTAGSAPRRDDRVGDHGHLVPVPQAGLRAREHQRQPGRPEPQHRLGADVDPGRAHRHRLLRRVLGVAHPHRRRPVRVRHPPGRVRHHGGGRHVDRDVVRLRVVEGARRLPLRAHAGAPHAAVPARHRRRARTRSPSTSGRSTSSRPRWRSSPRC